MPSLPRLSSERRSDALELARDAWRRAWTAMRRTPGLFAVSLVLGTALWVFVTDVENPTILDTVPAPVPVEPVNVDETLAVANLPLPSVEVRIAAPQDRWDRLDATNLRAFVDLRDRDARQQEVPVQVEVTGISGVRVVEVEPRIITVNLEDLVSAEVEVTARPIGSPPVGYELQGLTPSVETVQVTGPGDLVARVTSAVAMVNVTGLTVGVDQGATLEPLGEGGGAIRGVQLTPNAVTVAVEIAQRTSVRAVPLSVEVVGEPDPGYRVTGVAISPATVQVEGLIDVLQQLDRIRLPSINIEGARSDIVRSVAIPLGEGVEQAGRERATVTISIEPVIGQLRTQVELAAEGLANNRSASYEPGTVDVLLEGPLPVLNGLVNNDLRAFLDLRDLAPGSWDVPVQISVPDTIDVQAVQPESVTVTIDES